MEFNRSVDISKLPQANVGRSVFDRSAPLYTTFNTGSLVPLYIDDILPGDSFKVTTNLLARLQTLITPIMANLYLDVAWFYVPSRILWSHFKEFMGENTTGHWTPNVDYVEPHEITRFGAKTIGDYFAIPTDTRVDVSILPFRAYCMIWNEFFRDENLQDPVLINLGDSPAEAPSGFDPNSWESKLNYAQYGLTGLLPANKYHDIFTSCLPSPQKGPDVDLPIAGFAPVITMANNWSDLDLMSYGPAGTKRFQPLRFKTLAGDSGADSLTTITTSQNAGFNSSGMLSRESGSSVMATSVNHPIPANLGANLGAATFGTINDLRLAFATQRFYEQLARSGSRYTEILAGVYGIESPDARLQRPEFLGMSHVTLNVDQVVQTSESSENSPLGDTGAYSLSFDSDFSFEKSFVEHGYLIAVGCARYSHNYQQGLRKMWSRRDRFDYYWPQFASIGEVPVLGKEIFADGSSNDDSVFGYQEAWYDYRYNTQGACITGEMRSNYAQSLDVWHLGDDYESRPYLSSDWIMEDKSNVDRVLTVKSSVADQILLNAWFDIKATRPLPVYSIPGGLDMR